MATEPNSSIRLAAIVGSLRAGSFHRVLFNAAVELADELGDDVTPVEIFEVTVRDLPFYDGDVEAEGDPDAVVRLKTAVQGADGLIVFTPEYNRGVPAVTKNAIDWLSRPAGDGAVAGTPVGVVAASPGRHDVAGVRGHLAQTLASVAPLSLEDSLGMSSISRRITDGRLDDDARTELGAWLQQFVEHVRAHAS